MTFTGAEITCETVIFRNAGGGCVVAEVKIIVIAIDTAHAQEIQNYGLNINSMDIGNITANNETYVTTAVNSTGKTV